VAWPFRKVLEKFGRNNRTNANSNLMHIKNKMACAPACGFGFQTLRKRGSWCIKYWL